MGGGSSQGGSTTQRTEPWSYQIPFLQAGMNNSYQLFGNNNFSPPYYPDSTVAPQSSQTQTAIQMQTDMSAQASPEMQAAKAMQQRTLGGDFLNANPVNGYLGNIASGKGPTEGQDTFRALGMTTPMQGQQQFQRLGKDFQSPTVGQGMLFQQSAGGANPYLDAAFNSAAGKVQSSMAGQFAKAGRYGSGAQGAATGDALGDLATKLYGGAYESDANRRLQATQALSSAEQQQRAQQLSAAQGLAGAEQNRVGNQMQSANIIGNAWGQERANQMQAMMFAPQLQNADLQRAAAMAEAGNARDSYAQDLLNADINRYNYMQLSPVQNLQGYMQMIGGNYGGTTQGTQTAARGSKAGGVLGGAMSGAAAGTMAYPGWGTAIGAVGGGLMGLLGSE